MLKRIIERKYITLALAVIGYCLAVLSVIIFLNIDSSKERFLWAVVWLICCNLSSNLYKRFKAQENYNYKK